MRPPHNAQSNDDQRPDDQRPPGYEQAPIEQVTYSLLVRVAARLESELNRVFRPFDLTAATYNILLVLQDAGAGGQSCGDISEQLIAEVPDMTRLLDRLERLGYVARERSSIDRRMVKVTLTEKGSLVLAGLRDPVRDCHVRQLGHLGEAKLSELGLLLKVVLNRSQVSAKQPRVGDIRTAVDKHSPH
jgi:DNA-binding MarR family transcriptional regulator